MFDTRIPLNNLIDKDTILSNTEDRVISINDTEVIIKQYLPVNEKLELITNVLAESLSNEYSFKNPLQINVFILIEIVKFYTNIELDENLTLDNLYDCLVTSGIGSKVISHIPAEEYDFIRGSIVAQLDEYYDYKNSALGIMESIVKDYSNVNLEAGEVQKKLADPQNLALLKDIMKKLG